MTSQYKIEIPRASYDGLCAFLAQWGELYAQPGAVVFKGTMRQHSKHGKGNAFLHPEKGGDAKTVSLRFNAALCGLGRAKVLKNEVHFDLRDLNDDEMDAMLFVAQNAVLKPQQTRVMNRVARGITSFLALPAMVRIAMAAAD